MPSDSASGPRYAPEDPTLPEPWKGLVDGKTGYIYYWNPETDVTQYEKPIKDKSRKAVCSSVHREERFESQGGRLNGSRLYSSGDNVRNSAKEPGRARVSSDANGSLSAEAYRRKNEITVIGDDVPPPYITFESTGFPGEILKEVHRAGFTAPTPIQAQSWPIALQSRDVVAIAKTGSGKTLGYLIPGFLHLKRLRNNPRMGPTVLVLAPTRELATQIQDEADKFGRSSRIECTCIYGGAPKGPQLMDLDQGVDVVVATPGRLNDILEMRRINLQQVSYLVLDEADRMLDMGFEPQIRKIVKEIPDRRQTLMYTATWPKEVRKIAADLLVDPVQVNIGSIDELVANKAITQYVEMIKPIEKQRRLEQILRSQEPGSKVIIFCSTKKMCDQLARNLTRQFRAAAIHGDKNQIERDRVLGNFRTGRSPILVATDVAARGLDIKDIRVVINFDFPTGVEDYVHRIGRTGRAGATGVSYTFFSDQDSKFARELVKVLQGADQHVPPQLWDMVTHGHGGKSNGFGGKSRRWGPVAHDQGRPNGMVGPGLGRSGVRGMPFPNHADHVSHDRYNNDRGYQGRQLRDIPSGSPRAETRGRPDIKAMPSRGRVRSRSISRSLSPSPKRAHVWSGPRGSRSISPSLRRNLRLPAPKKTEPSYDDGKIRDDLSPRTKKERSRSPVYSRNRYMKRSRSPPEDVKINREKSGFPFADDRRVEGSYYSPPNCRNGAEKLPTVRSRPLFYNGEEVEEGMILPDEDEGLIYH